MEKYFVDPHLATWILLIVEDGGHDGCVVVAVVAKLLRGDEISKLLNDRGKESEPRSQGRRGERGGEECIEKRGMGSGKGEEALIIAIHFLVRE